MGERHHQEHQARATPDLIGNEEIIQQLLVHVIRAYSS